LDYAGGDAETRVVAGYMEGIGDGSEFIRAASKATRNKPVIIWKTGRTKSGARAASSHTGALAGTDEVCDAAFKQAGVIRAEHLYELIDFATAFSSPHPPAGRRVGILVEAGGGAVSSADACESSGLEVPPLSIDAQAELRDYLTELGVPAPSTANPIDLVWPPRHVYARLLSKCMELLFNEVDMVLWITYNNLSDESFIATVEGIKESAGKPLFVVPTYPTMQSEGLSIYTRSGIPGFPTAERAVRAISALVKYSTRQAER
jgi:acetyltransferase